MKRPWLAPLVPLYAAGAAWHVRRLKTRRLNWPVVSIGNLSTGGAGKTPLTITLARLLASRGLHVDVLSRGYGRASHEAARVRPDGTAAEFGDEPLLIARAAQAPVYVAAQRYDAGALAERAYAPQSEAHAAECVHLLDDGFQHRQLSRDVDIVLLNREDWQDALLPAGNLREPLSAVRRATVVAIPAEDTALQAELRAWGWSGPVWRLRRTMQMPTLTGPVFAFCGIARPGQFFSGLEAAGLQIAGRKAFPDHYDYTEHVVEWLTGQARRIGAAALVTTEKDAVRLGPLTGRFMPQLPLRTVELTTAIKDEDLALEWLLHRLNAAPAL